jgi:hypothetical protein
LILSSPIEPMKYLSLTLSILSSPIQTVNAVYTILVVRTFIHATLVEKTVFSDGW